MVSLWIRLMHLDYSALGFSPAWRETLLKEPLGPPPALLSCVTAKRHVGNCETCTHQLKTCFTYKSVNNSFFFFFLQEAWHGFHAYLAHIQHYTSIRPASALWFPPRITRPLLEASSTWCLWVLHKNSLHGRGAEGTIVAPLCFTPTSTGKSSQRLQRDGPREQRNLPPEHLHLRHHIQSNFWLVPCPWGQGKALRQRRKQQWWFHKPCVTPKAFGKAQEVQLNLGSKKVVWYLKTVIYQISFPFW